MDWLRDNVHCVVTDCRCKSSSSKPPASRSPHRPTCAIWNRNTWKRRAARHRRCPPGGRAAPLKQFQQARGAAARPRRQSHWREPDDCAGRSGDGVRSGGKDSYTLLDMLMSLQRSAPIRFEIVAVNLDQKQPGFPAEVLPRAIDRTRRAVPDHRGYLCRGQARRCRGQDAVRTVFATEGAARCIASAENGVTEIALGHHRDDIVETLFVTCSSAAGSRRCRRNCSARIGGTTSSAIRPLCRVAERDIGTLRLRRGNFPIIPCTLCGSQKRICNAWSRRACSRIGSRNSPAV